MFNLTCPYCGTTNDYIGYYDPEIKTLCNICKKEINPVILYPTKTEEWMYKNIIIFALILLLSALLLKQHYDQDDFSIRKTNVGYDIYRNDQLQHEFTTRNTDSLSMETLGMIYEQ